MARRDDSADGDPIDTLFQLPLSEFTAARNALAATLKKGARPAEAEKVLALAKPAISAWAVNQLRWHHRRDLDKLLAAGDRFREAQTAQIAGGSADLRGTLEARRAALSAMTARAAEMLRKAGHQPTPDLMRRVSTTLDALATYGSLPEAPPAGRLTSDLEAPGFEALATLIPRGGSSARGSSAPRVLPFANKSRGREAAKGRPAGRSAKGAAVAPEEAKRRREAELAAQRAAARKVVEAAEAALREARAAERQAETALKKVAARAKTAEQARTDAEQRLEAAQKASEEATREARLVARQAEEATQAVSDAERELEQGRAAMDRIGGGGSDS